MSGSGIIPSIGKIQKEISVWETRVAEKEKDASILSSQLRHSNLLKFSLSPYPVYVSSFYYLAYIVK